MTLRSQGVPCQALFHVFLMLPFPIVLLLYNFPTTSCILPNYLMTLHNQDAPCQAISHKFAMLLFLTV